MVMYFSFITGTMLVDVSLAIEPAATLSCGRPLIADRLHGVHRLPHRVHRLRVVVDVSLLRLSHEVTHPGDKALEAIVHVSRYLRIRGHVLSVLLRSISSGYSWTSSRSSRASSRP